MSSFLNPKSRTIPLLDYKNKIEEVGPRENNYKPPELTKKMTIEEIELQELDFNEEIINEKQKDINQIEGVLINVRDIIIDASKEVNKQGEMLR